VVVVAEQLRELMASGFSQGEIARRVGLTQPTISRLLAGLHSDTRSAAAARIKALHDAVIPKRKRPPKPREAA
jgi:transcriptional regulator with XRE-family HTH domain